MGTVVQPTTDVSAGSGPLFEPGRIGRMTLRNRFVQAPIFTQFAGTWGEVGDRLVEYHRARARGGVGLIITENTSVDWLVGRTVGHPIRIDHDRFRAGLTDLVEAVHNEGAKVAVQLHHTGRQNSQGVPRPRRKCPGSKERHGQEPRCQQLHQQLITNRTGEAHARHLHLRRRRHSR